MNMPKSQPASLTSLIRQVRLAKGFLVFLPHPNVRRNPLQTGIADR
jgi:hypothetical protein